MRITNEMQARMLTEYLLRNRSAAFNLQAQIADGRRVRIASDDPGDYPLIARLHESQSAIRQFAENADRVSQELLTLDGTLQSMLDVLHRASEIAVNAGDSTLHPDGRRALGEEADLLLEDLVRTANSSANGRYTFSGLRTDTMPYEITRDADGRITEVAYQGNTGVRQGEVDRGVLIQANVPGSDLNGSNAVFQTQEVDLFVDLIQLRDRLLAGENVADDEAFTADASTDILTVSNVYTTGSSVRLATDGTLPAGLDADTTYYAIRVSATEIRLADSLANARAGVFVDLTDAGAGTHSLTQQTLSEINQGLDHLISILSKVGAREDRLELNQRILGQKEIMNATSLEKEEAIDVAEAVIELSNKQLAYEAALRIASQALDLSLMNFI